jgi:biotin operon repressor
MSTEAKILQILNESNEVRLTDLVEITGSSRQMVHRAVKTLLEKGLVQKIGSAPKTFYKIKPSSSKQGHQIDSREQQFLDEHFLLVTETGTRLSGVDAIIHWCNRQKLPIEKTASEFIATRKKYLSYFEPSGLINGNKKIRNTKGLERIGLDQVYYLDFYAIERFGKTRLGTLLHLAKQGQNRKLMDEIIEISKDRINRLIKTERMEAVGYIPPTIKREVQFMKVLERKLNLPLPHIALLKVKGEIVIPQKALSKIEDRVANARFSILVTEKRKFKKVLLIDDAIGSGATMNETAIKLKDAGLASLVVGLAITGSFKGFEVIQEV